MSWVVLLLGGYALTVVTWVLYLAVMRLVPVRDQLHLVARVHAYALLAVALAFDVALNVLVGTVVFLEWPHYRRLLLTARLDRLAKHDDGWRGDLAEWVCNHLLDQFDPSGRHCVRADR